MREEEEERKKERRRREEEKREVGKRNSAKASSEMGVKRKKRWCESWWCGRKIEKLQWIPCKRSYGIANCAAIGRNEAERT